MAASDRAKDDMDIAFEPPAPRPTAAAAAAKPRKRPAVRPRSTKTPMQDLVAASMIADGANSTGGGGGKTRRTAGAPRKRAPAAARRPPRKKAPPAVPADARTVDESVPTSSASMTTTTTTMTTTVATGTDAPAETPPTAATPKSRSGGQAARAQPNDPEAPQLIMRAWPHVREMLLRRGYNVSGSSTGDRMSHNITESKARKAPIYRVLEPLDQERIDADRAAAVAEGKRRARVNCPVGPIMVVFTAVPRINVETVRAVVERIKRIQRRDGAAAVIPKRVLILSCHGRTPPVLAEIAKLTSLSQLRIDMAIYAQHFFCTVDHQKVPRHDILNAKERESLLKNLHIDRTDLLPHQKYDDPVSYYYGLDVGDIVLYYRQLGTLELIYYYRVVVASGPVQ